jgi:excinuclease UvrABC ATPase subunit
MENYSSKLLNRILKVRVNGQVVDITSGMKLDRYKTHDIEIVVDRMVVEATADNEKTLKRKDTHAPWRKCTNDIRSRFERGALL